ncbi:uncharacterized protein METZ01_LOCUS334755, partial [marine metagenome]
MLAISYTRHIMFRTTKLSKGHKVRRDRLVVLTFAGVLLILIYGPLTPWFIAADRLVYDTFATNLRANTLDSASIITIDPSDKSDQELLTEYGLLIQAFKKQSASRVVLADPPKIRDDVRLAGWVALMSGDIPIVVPENHRLAAYSSNTGVFLLQADSDNVLRKSRLWHLVDGNMKPSLPLAVALTKKNFVVDPRLSFSDFEIYHSKYSPILRLSAQKVLSGSFPKKHFSGQTIFIESAPDRIGVAATLPSGQN